MFFNVQYSYINQFYMFTDFVRLYYLKSVLNEVLREMLENTVLDVLIVSFHSKHVLKIYIKCI